ncbi:MAG TPA: maltotransferase domain-containing protein [Thermomicrobiales bacterium]|nr:maltotransferase domain-containing protein [Thermomicrobiales bacterium]
MTSNIASIVNDEQTSQPPSSISIEDVRPQIDCGRYPVKREVGDVLDVSADIFREGHDKIAAVVRHRDWTSDEWSEVEMHVVDNDRWSASFLLLENTRVIYTIEAFPDVFGTWRDEVQKKLAAGLDVASELLEGQHLVEEVRERASPGDRAAIDQLLGEVRSAVSQAEAATLLFGEKVNLLVHTNRSRAGKAVYPHELTVIVDRVAARYAAWYEMFPRSAGTVPDQSATFRDVINHLPRIQSMGFDVLYFTPIHPIGETNRKGRNNTLVPQPGDPGVPYAIGSDAGGHDAIEPGLGSVDDFRDLVEVASEHGLEIALDLAIQASPDHPWAKEHPDWFYIRPDGSIKYAENPPKKYEDIYPINFQNPDWQNLWNELKRIVLHWVGLGVKTFRVDNPHTKPTVFWEWLITDVHREHPDVIFLSEAFTRPKVMKALAKAGFAQSYTYFTWRNFKRELIEYLEELTQTDVKEYLRGNFFVNTHDILPIILQEGGRPAFKMRLVLAATLSSVYGIYSGYELCENTPVPGKEEYLHSEKYEYKVWDWDRPGNIVDYVSLINRIRREHPALQEYENLRFFPASDDNVICYGKATAEYEDIVVAAVNLDPFQPHDATIRLPIEQWGIAADEQYRVTELVTGESYIWTGSEQQIHLNPREEPAMIFEIVRWQHVDYAEPCF